MFGLLMLVLVASVNAVTRDQQFLDPNASQIIKGTAFTFQVDVNGTLYSNGSGLGSPSGTGNVTNVTILATPTTGGTAVVLCANATNVNNETSSTWICEGGTQALEDRLTYNISAQLYNKTNAAGGTFSLLNTTSSLTVVVDNTIPTASISTTANTIFSSTTTTLSAAVSNLSTCRFEFGKNIIAGTVNVARDTCSLTLSRTSPPDGDYSVILSATDNTNITTTSERQFRVNFASNANTGSRDISVAAEGGAIFFQQNKTILIILGLILFVIVLVNKGKK